jgi:hypothetical protein
LTHDKGVLGEMRRPVYGGSFDMMMVPEAANMPPTPWQTEIFAPGICAGGFALDDTTAGVGARQKTRIFEAVDRRMR